MRTLKNKVVVITGASSGIGRECAYAFHRAGAFVVIAARRRALLDEVKTDIESDGGKCLCVTTDVAESDQVQRLLDATLEHFGRVDIWINNAGFGHVTRFETMTPEEMERIWQVNFMGSFHGCQAALQQMRRQGSGRIMNVSSMLARLPLPLNAGYCSTKAALSALSESLDLELEGSGIRVINVMPGVTETAFTDAMVTRIPRPPIHRRVPTKSARDVAEMIVRCTLRPKPVLAGVPLPNVTFAALSLFPGIWRLIARRYLKHRLSGESIETLTDRPA